MLALHCTTQKTSEVGHTTSNKEAQPRQLHQSTRTHKRKTSKLPACQTPSNTKRKPPQQQNRTAASVRLKQYSLAVEQRRRWRAPNLPNPGEKRKDKNPAAKTVRRREWPHLYDASTTPHPGLTRTDHSRTPPPRDSPSKSSYKFRLTALVRSRISNLRTNHWPTAAAQPYLQHTLNDKNSRAQPIPGRLRHTETLPPQPKTSA